MDKIIQSKKLTSYELEIEKFLEEKINTLTTSEYLFRQSDEIYNLTFENLINILDRRVREFQKNVDFSLQLKEKYKNKDFSKDMKDIFEKQIEFQEINIKKYGDVTKYLLDFVRDKNKTKKEKIENLIENKDYLIENVKLMNKFHHILKDNNHNAIQRAIDLSPNKSIMQFLSDKKEELFGNKTIKRTQKLK
tara:strand:+ start:544 stop:1119 length:576 start_codon:yes stop_codon:yes gene_type:complete